MLGYLVRCNKDEKTYDQLSGAHLWNLQHCLAGVAWAMAF